MNKDIINPVPVIERKRKLPTLSGLLSGPQPTKAKVNQRVVLESNNSLKISVVAPSEETKMKKEAVKLFATPSKSISSIISYPLPRLSAVDLEKEFQTKRGDIVLPNGFISTPLHVMKVLAHQYKADIHSEVHKICFLNADINQAMWRVEVFVANTFGIGESPRRALSFQLAAADLLQKTQENYPSYPIKPYGLIPGCLIKPKVHKDLFEMCFEKKLPKPFFEEKKMHKFNQKIPNYFASCKVGNFRVTVGRSDIRILASRIAAKKMIILISEENYNDEIARIGNECSNLECSDGFPAPSFEKQKWLDLNLLATNKICKDTIKTQFLDLDNQQKSYDNDDLEFLDFEEDIWYDAVPDF